jgi:biotin/methionine sulfoxide reductase
MTRKRSRTLMHWGVYDVETEDGRLAGVTPWAEDRDPSPIGRSLVEADHPLRVTRPMVRKGWLEEGPASRERRGGEPFVPVDWDEALDLVAGELERVRREHGNQAIFAGSYGWASAGRFHHAQSQVHRFMNAIGGYTASVNTYSHAATEVIVPHVFGFPYEQVKRASTSLPVVAEHTQLFIAFGGLALKNAQIQSGGQGRHVVREWLNAARGNGCRFVSISPIADDTDPALEAEWWAPRPNSDTALMLALSHTLIAEGLHDPEFLRRCTAGYEQYRAYLMGESDGQAKDADWAAAICSLDARDIRALAREMAAKRTMVNLSWSMQRAEYGEQTIWAGIALAAVLGQIGLPGGGVTLGYSSAGGVGNGVRRVKLPALPRLANPIDSFIPVARIADLLEKPGEQFDYDGQRRTYPDTRLVYWAGGNPFHHHQDLNRLVAAWKRPETVVVNDPFWSGAARHADIVLPATTPLERNDFGGSSEDSFLIAMKQAIPPVAQARNDYDIFAGLAERLGVGDSFTEGRTADEWLRHLYDGWRRKFNEMPDFDTFWEQGHIEFKDDTPGQSYKVFLDAFRTDPDTNALPTPSGRIEISSQRIAGFGYEDCPPHPSWHAPREWLGSQLAEIYPLHLMSNQPATRLHSQYDHGPLSLESKVAGREAATLHPEDAAARGIGEGDVVRLYNDRGACLAGARLSDRVRRGVVVLPTGAQFDPEQPGHPGALEKHGNPNVLTRDAGTSSLAQGPSAHSCLVEVERYDGTPPPVTALQPPPMARR